MFSKDGISAVPIIDKDGIVVNMYETVDVIVSGLLCPLRVTVLISRTTPQTLVRSGSYQSLDLTMSSALSQRSSDFPGVITCTVHDSLASILLLIKQRRVHRLVVVEGDADSKTRQNRSAARDESVERSPPALPGSKPQKGRLVGIITLSDILRYLIGQPSSGEAWDEEFSSEGNPDATSVPLRGENSSSKERSSLGLYGSGNSTPLTTPGMSTPGDEAGPS